MRFVRKTTAKIILFSLSVLGGCAHVSPDDACADFGEVQYCPQSNPTLAPFTATRAVMLVRGEEMQRLIVQIQVDAHGLQLAGLTPLGRRVLWLQLDHANQLHVSSELAVDARQILAGLQFADWPIEQVRAAARGEEARVLEAQEQRGITRWLLDGERVILTATCDGERPHCKHAELRYETLDFRLDVDALDEAPK